MLLIPRLCILSQIHLHTYKHHHPQLKSGSFATVCRGTHRATGKKVAIKCVLRKDLPPGDDAAIYDEVLILSTLQHSYICPLIDFFEERECYFLIMELMSGGDLFDRIGAKKCYTENDARSLCRKMLESVRYCHENSVAHCDMKPKNLLLVSDDDDVSIKLADFGFATRVYEPRSLTKQCGTPFFVGKCICVVCAHDVCMYPMICSLCDDSLISVFSLDKHSPGGTDEVSL